jgi:hypothetical protein
MIGRKRPGAAARLALAALAGAGALVAVSGSARAYVRYVTDAGKPHAWNTACVWIHSRPYNLTGLSPEMVHAALEASAGAWSSRSPELASCTYLDVRTVLEPPEAAIPAARYDKANHFIVRADRWCPALNSNPADCYDRRALALTSVFSIKSTGQIVDADIEVNGVNYAWRDLEISPDPDDLTHDLQNALTHEMGHFIGLDHTCFDEDPLHPRPRPVDNTGTLVMDCASASDEVRATTMFASAMPGDLSKRTLSADDQLAVCEIYPLARNPMTCPSSDLPPPGGGGGCAVAQSPPAGSIPGGLALLALAACWARIRSGRRR